MHLWTRRAASLGALSLWDTCLPDVSLPDGWLEECPAAWMRAVRQERRLFYRGEVSVDRPTVLSPPPDLLDMGTYGSPEALEYFQCLERQWPSSGVRPSAAHIATANGLDAAAWGEVVSVWPLGKESLSYVWRKDHDVFYPPGICDANDYVHDEHLEVALRQGKEVMWSTLASPKYDRPPSCFLAVPSKYDNLMLEWLL